jgi:hypothetical protein
MKIGKDSITDESEYKQENMPENEKRASETEKDMIFKRAKIDEPHGNFANNNCSTSDQPTDSTKLEENTNAKSDNIEKECESDHDIKTIDQNITEDQTKPIDQSKVEAKGDQDTINGENTSGAFNFPKSAVLENIVKSENIFKSNKKGPSKVQKQSLFLEKHFIDIVDSHNKTKDHNIFSVKCHLYYFQDNEWISISTGKAEINESIFTFTRDFFSSVYLRFPVKTIKFNRAENEVFFKCKTRKPTQNTCEIIEREYKLEFNNQSDLEDFLLKVHVSSF